MTKIQLLYFFSIVFPSSSDDLSRYLYFRTLGRVGLSDRKWLLCSPMYIFVWTKHLSNFSITWLIESRSRHFAMIPGYFTYTFCVRWSQIVRLCTRWPWKGADIKLLNNRNIYKVYTQQTRSFLSHFCQITGLEL